MFGPSFGGSPVPGPRAWTSVGIAQALPIWVVGRFVDLRMAIHQAILSLVSLYDGCRSSTAPKRMSEVPGLLDLRHLLGSPEHI